MYRVRNINGQWWVIGYCGKGYWCRLRGPFGTARQAEQEMTVQRQADADARRLLKAV
jgi:hypothetical protein